MLSVNIFKGVIKMSINYFFGDGAISFLAVIAAVALTVLAFIFIVPEKKFGKLNKFGQFLHKTLNFKYLIIEKILQALYIFFTALVILVGVVMLFSFTSSYNGLIPARWLGGYGLLYIIFGPIIVRIIFEFIMMAILLVKNVISINNKLKNQNPDANGDDIFATPDIDEIKSAFTPTSPEAPVVPVAAAPTDPVANQPSFCTKCGAPLDKNGKCPNCDQVN